MGLEGAFGSICRLRERPFGIDIQYIHMYIGAGRRASLRSDNSPTRCGSPRKGVIDKWPWPCNKQAAQLREQVN